MGRSCLLFVSYGIHETMIELRETEVYARWFKRLRDHEAQARILTRIRRLLLGNPGDVKPVGEGYQKCGSITVPVIASTLHAAGTA